MKKILVIGLAAAMMTSTAFANTLEPLKPGDQIVFAMSDFVDQNKLYVTDNTGTVQNYIVPDKYNISTTGTVGNGTKEAVFYAKDGSTQNKLGATWTESSIYGENAGTQWQHATANNFGLKIDGTPAAEAAKKKIDMVARQDIENYDFTATNFTVSVNAPVGKNLIKNYEFDGAGNLIVNLKTDYRLPSESKPDLIITDVTVKSKRDIKKISDSTKVALYKNRSFVARTATGTNSATSKIGPDTHFSVGVETMEEQLTVGNEIDMAQHITDNDWVKFTAGDAYSGDVKFDGGNIVVKGKVYNGDVVNLQYNAAPTDAAIKVIQNNPVEANIMVHNIIAKNFKTGFTVSIPGSSLFGAEADANGNVEVLSLVAANNKKLYLLSNTGVLTAAPFVYNNNTAAWEGRLPAQGGTILISDVALKGVTAGTTTGTGNPSTGFGVDFSSAVVK